MYGLITRLTAYPGRRDELALLLMDPAVRKHGCHSYIVAHDLADPDILWVTEVWVDQPTHQSWSEGLRDSGAWRPIYGLMAKMDDSIQTRPLGGLGL